MNKIWQMLIGVALLGSLAAAAPAQTSSGPASKSGSSSKAKNPLEEITVYATRMNRPLADVPAAVSVINEKDIQQGQQQLALDESLKRVPGVFMQDRYNFAQDLRISIRGFGARANFGIRGIKILVDGIPETLPDGQGSVDAVDLGSAKEIQVIRGPSSSLYGNASGGVISITTQDPPKQPTANMRVSGGDFGFHNLQFKYGAQGDRVGYVFDASSLTYDGFRQHSKYEDDQLNGRLNFDLGHDRKLLTVLSYTDQPVSDDPGALTAQQAALDPTAASSGNLLYDAGESLTESRIGFVYTAPLGAGQQITARNYYVWRNFDNSLPFQSGGMVHFDRFFTGGGVSYTNDGIWLDRPNHLIVGVDYNNQDDHRKRHDNELGVTGALTLDQDEHVTSTGVFAEDQLSLTPKTGLTLGLRHDQVRFDVTDHYLIDGNDSGQRTLDAFSPMAGVNYSFSSRLKLYGTYSTSFETPTTTEFNKPSGGGGFNPNVDPQKARNLEVGIRGLLKSTSRYEMDLYRITVKGELVPFEVPGNPGRDYYVNAGRSNRKGFEASLLSNWTDHLQTTLSYTYSDFKFDRFVDANGNDYAGNTIPGTARDQFFGEIEYTNSKGWYAALDANYTGKQYANNANTAGNDPYTLVSLRFGSQHDLGSIVVSPFLGISNALDERYNANVRLNAFGGRYYEPGPGRNYYAGVNVRFKLQ
jgi:iron complex outermembrane receptor protein